MRLTCPNCGAEYEVPDEVIPTSGRDVQCSNCGDTWFQYHPAHMPEPEEDEDDSGDDLVVDSWDDTEEDEDDYVVPPPPPAAARTVRTRPLSPEVKNILREEAQIEGRARGSAEGLESQPDLGLGEPVSDDARRAAEAEARKAQIKGEEKPSLRVSKEEAEENRSRRNLLPDIEEINSTLRRTQDGSRRHSATVDTTASLRNRRGFRGGFMLVLIVVLVAAIIYLQAPRIATAIPQLAGPIDSYVTVVNRGRVWLDDKAQTLAERLDEMSTEDSETPEAAPAPATDPAPEGTATE